MSEQEIPQRLGQILTADVIDAEYTWLLTATHLTDEIRQSLIAEQAMLQDWLSPLKLELPDEYVQRLLASRRRVMDHAPGLM